MKDRGRLDQLALMLLSGALGVLLCALLFDGVLRELFIYAASITFVCGLAIGVLHLVTRR